MHEAFMKGYDVHSYVACILFNLEYKEFMAELETSAIYKQNRDITKNTNFGILYGAGKKRIQNQLAGSGIHMSLSEVSNFYLRYMDTFSHVKNFVNSVQSTVRRRGYIFNHYGRHKRVPANKAYVGVNYLIQGLTADMLKEGMMRCEQVIGYGKTKLMLAVHDEIDFLLHDDEHKLIPILKEVMEDYPWSRTPIVADVELGPNWGEMKKWQK
jgi:DNA polymerase I-like protein with 3'-5' exonuclease and polymerase domains